MREADGRFVTYYWGKTHGRFLNNYRVDLVWSRSWQQKKKSKKQHWCTHIKNWIFDVNEYEKVKLQEKIIENSAKEEIE